MGTWVEGGFTAKEEWTTYSISPTGGETVPPLD